MQIYLDANASSRLRPVAAEAVARCIGESPLVTNPSSVHFHGRAARAWLSLARQQIRSLLSESREEPTIVFTSGATEACNAAIFGLLPEVLQGRNCVASALEHQAILEPIKWLEQRGMESTLLQPNDLGVHTDSEFCSAVNEHTELVAIMAANNVTGAINPVADISVALRAKGYQGIILCDATQAVGKSGVSLGAMLAAGVDAITLSGHKLGAPSGIGALVLNGAVCRRFEPLLIGGVQEQRFRAGTENLYGAVAFGAVAQFLQREGERERERIARCRELLWNRLESSLTARVFRVTPAGGLCNTLAARFVGVRGDDLVVALDLAGVSCSTGSACSSGRQEVSHVFRSLLGEIGARECVRLSLDWDATPEIIEVAVLKILDAVGKFH